MRNSGITPWLLVLADPAGIRRRLPAPLLLAQWKKFLESAADHGVLPAAVRNLRSLLDSSAAAQLSVERTNGDLNAGPLRRLVEETLVTLRKHSGMSLILQIHGEELRKALARDAVPAVFIKGRDFAERLYPHAGLRTYRDIDLLVPCDAVADAERVLHRLGYQKSTADEGKYAGDYGQTAWEHKARQGIVVELHWDLVNCPSQRHAVSIGYADLQLESFVEGGLTFSRPSSASILLLACVHAALGHRFDRLQLICDIVQTCRGAAGKIDEAWLREAIDRTGASAAVRTSLRLGERTLQESLCRELQDRLDVRPLGAVWNWLLKPSLVIESQTPFNKIRRQMVREMLKRTA